LPPLAARMAFKLMPASLEGNLIDLMAGSEACP